MNVWKKAVRLEEKEKGESWNGRLKYWGKKSRNEDSDAWKKG
jgi:hypothetical protein